MTLVFIVGAAVVGFVIATMLAAGNYDRGFEDGRHSWMQAHPVEPDAIAAYLARQRFNAAEDVRLSELFTERYPDYTEIVKATSKGQGLAEYGLLLALIAIVAIIALIFVGAQISATLSTVGNAI